MIAIPYFGIGRWLALLVTVAATEQMVIAAPVPAPAPMSAGSQPKTSNPLDRIRLEATNELLTSEAVLKSLELTDEQRKKLEEAFSELNGPPPPPPKVMPNGVKITFRKLDPRPSLAAQRTFDKTVAGILTPTQAGRLKQIALQVKGPNAFLDRHVIRALELSAEQEDRIEDLIAKNGETPAKVDQAAKEYQQTMQSIRGVLTTTQSQRWEKLVGTVLPFDDLRPLQKPIGLAPTGGVVPGMPLNPVLPKP